MNRRNNSSQMSEILNPENLPFGQYDRHRYGYVQRYNPQHVYGRYGEIVTTYPEQRVNQPEEIEEFDVDSFLQASRIQLQERERRLAETQRRIEINERQIQENERALQEVVRNEVRNRRDSITRLNTSSQEHFEEFLRRVSQENVEEVRGKKCPICRTENIESEELAMVVGIDVDCCVCYSSKVQVVFKNCQHLCVCLECYNQI